VLDGDPAPVLKKGAKPPPQFLGDTLTRDCLQFCLTAISDWSNHSFLHVMPAKASCTDNNFPYHIDDVSLPGVNFVTDVGVKYDKLKFRPHIDRIVSKAALHAKLIWFQSCDPGLLSRVFVNLLDLLDLFLNMVVLFGILFKRDISKIESVHYQFAKHLEGFYSLSYTCRLILHL